MLDLLLLSLLVLFASTVQTTVGFGFMLVAVSLSSILLDVDQVVAVLLPLSFAQSAVIAFKDRSQIVRRLLVVRILPLMLVGLLLSELVAPQDARFLRPLLGLGILTLAIKELFTVADPSDPVPWRGNLAIVVAGFVQGLFATGGPPLVWAVGRQGLDKQAFRATLAMVWTVLNLLLIALRLWRGTIDSSTLSQSAVLMVPVAVGLVAGNWLHRTVDEARFGRLLWTLLALASLPLILRWFWS